MKILFESLKEASADLNKAASDIMTTFSSDNVDDFLRIKPIEVNIKDFIDTLAFKNKMVFQNAGIRLKIDDIPEEWDIIVDKTILWDVMNNILDNARVYADRRVSIKVEKKAQPEETYLFRIIDDGPGVDPAIKDRLFKPGIRGKGKDKNRKKIGHGFGLYLSYRAVKKHGGKLYLNEGSSAGTEFVIELPAKFTD